MQRADDVSTQVSHPGESYKSKGPSDASRSKGKGKVYPVDKKDERKRIAAKAKADFEAGRIPIFLIGGTYDVQPFDARVTQSLGIPPPAFLRVSFDSLRRRSCQRTFTHVDPVLPLYNADPQHKATLISLIGGVGVNLPDPDTLSILELFIFDWAKDAINVISIGNRIFGAFEADVRKREKRIKTLASRSEMDAAWQEASRQMHRADSREATTSENQQTLNNLFDEASALKDEKQRLEEDIKKKDANLEVTSAEVTKLEADLEKFLLTEGHLRKERDEAHWQADQIASGSSAQSTKHSSRLERIRSYLVTLQAQEEAKAQPCYRRGDRISLERMVEVEYEFPLGLLENYIKEEKEYLAQVESFNVDSLGDDTLFPTSVPPPAGLPQDVASQVLERISEHGSFFPPLDKQDGDQV
ncbi:hypothetical protein AALP_AA8G187000 [Arabis alpina]|uniref:Uncharacterized protein n=1 Tax=Arabis alpina TaxID=50452 RepID=A0A087G7X2_ARAAL|nr:hypothetical protein AALP_AA8G187000 [Arabis alpina]